MAELTKEQIYHKEYRNRPEVKAKKQSPEFKVKLKTRRQQPKIKAKEKNKKENSRVENLE